MKLQLLFAAGALMPWPTPVRAMRKSQIDELRKTSAQMFYHGYTNYMEHAFPEDEVRARK